MSSSTLKLLLIMGHDADSRQPCNLIGTMTENQNTLRVGHSSTNSIKRSQKGNHITVVVVIQ